MAEPVTHAAATATVLVAAPSLAVLFQVWPFGIALVAGCVALIYMAPMGRSNALRSVTGSVFAGGSLSQLCAMPALKIAGTFNSGIHDWAKEPDSRVATIALLAILIGLFAQSVIPKALKRAGVEVEGVNK